MSENISQLCRFCQKITKLAYYCEDCGSSCCSDCLKAQNVEYYACQACKSRSIANLDSDGKRKCKDCGKEAVKISQHIRKCPKCSSSNILNIFEKKEELEKKFLGLIKNIRTFVEPFIDLHNKLNSLRDKLKEARNPPIRCYHYPRMEGEMVSLFKLFNESVNTLLDKINIHLHHFTLNQEFFFDIYKQPNSSIGVIKGILINLLRSEESIVDYISKNVKVISESIKKGQKVLQFIDEINKYFLSYKQYLNLASKEKPVYAIKAIYNNGYNPQGLARKTKGIIFITNFDISFVHISGWPKKRNQMILKAPVDDLLDVRAKGKFKKKLYLEFAYGKYEFVLPSKSLSKIIEYIVLAKRFDETTKHNKNAAEKLHAIELDINNLINFIEEAINSFFSLKCQYNQQFGESKVQEIEQNPQMTPSYSPQIRMSTVPGNQQFPFSQNVRSSPISATDVHMYTNNHAPIQSHNAQVNVNIDNDERAYLLRRLGRFQTEIPQPPYPNNAYNNEWFHKAGLNRQVTPNDAPFINPTYENYNKYHLSDYFVPNPRTNPESKRIRELKKERYSLNKTIERLDYKLDQGVLSEDDYFRIYTKIQNQITTIDEKVEGLKNDLYG